MIDSENIYDKKEHGVLQSIVENVLVNFTSICTLLQTDQIWSVCKYGPNMFFV